jgi:hypothetical protein
MIIKLKNCRIDLDIMTLLCIFVIYFDYKSYILLYTILYYIKDQPTPSLLLYIMKQQFTKKRIECNV